MNSLIKVIDRVATHIPSDFIAPVLDADTTEIFALLDGIPYRYRINHLSPGWYKFIPIPKRLIVDRNAYPHEYIPYLESLPRFYVISLYRLSPYTWLCVPYSAADAEQRGWTDSTPRQLHLITTAIQPLDIIEARMFGDTPLYLRTRPMMSTVPNLPLAKSILDARAAELQKEAERLALEEMKKTTEGWFGHRLGLVGASLDSWDEEGEAIRVRWTHRGRQRSMLVERSGRIRSAGVCLDGGDGDYDLAAIVSVMEEYDNREPGW